MSTAAAELEELYDALMKVAESWGGSDEPAMTRLQNAAETVGESWSGSWIGYHANVYYDKLQPPLPGDHFSPEGLTCQRLQRSDGMEGIALRIAGRIQTAGDPDLSSCRLLLSYEAHF